MQLKCDFHQIWLMLEGENEWESINIDPVIFSQSCRPEKKIHLIIFWNTLYEQVFGQKEYSCGSPLPGLTYKLIKSVLINGFTIGQYNAVKLYPRKEFAVEI